MESSKSTNKVSFLFWPGKSILAKMLKFQIFFPLLEDVGGFGLYWACGIKGDGNERKQKSRLRQMSGGGTVESYIGFGCESAFWRKERAIVGLAVDLRFGGREGRAS